MNAMVHCYSGFRYAEKPLTIESDTGLITITEIISEWQTENGHTFVVATDSNYIFELNHNDRIDLWSVKPFNQ